MSYIKQKKGSTVKRTTKNRKIKHKDPYDDEINDFIYDSQRDSRHHPMKGLGDLGKS